MLGLSISGRDVKLNCRFIPLECPPTLMMGHPHQIVRHGDEYYDTRTDAGFPFSTNLTPSNFTGS
jgi:hypothetical protein